MVEHQKLSNIVVSSNNVDIISP